MNEYKNKKILVITKHQKEKAIGPVIQQQLGAEVHCISNFDTDQFGTFSGNIPRLTTPKDTVRDKCLSGLMASNYMVGIATEGSFGSHPEVAFLPYHEELMVFMDLKKGIEVIVKATSSSTTQFNKCFHDFEEAREFLRTIDFPVQGIVLKKEGNAIPLEEDMPENLPNAELRIHQLLEESGQVWIESDLRAHRNPSRMQLIQKLTYQLTKRLASQCPKCKHPGFGVTKAEKGLPCKQCGLPTPSMHYFISVCSNCAYEQRDINPKKIEDPMYCQICNP
jgi:hypothetical protein